MGCDRMSLRLLLVQRGNALSRGGFTWGVGRFPAKQLRCCVARVLLVPVFNAIAQGGIRSAAWGHSRCDLVF